MRLFRLAWGHCQACLARLQLKKYYMDNHRRTRHYSHSDNYSAHDVLARLKHDPTAPPFASLTCVLQLAGSGDVPVVGTCRGFVRSLRTCKYLTGCRYSHELKSLNDVK